MAAGGSAVPTEEGVVSNPRNQARECGGDVDGPEAQGVKDAVPSCSEEPGGQEIGYGVAENDKPLGNEQVVGDVAVKGEGRDGAGARAAVSRAACAAEGKARDIGMRRALSCTFDILMRGGNRVVRAAI